MTLSDEPHEGAARLTGEQVIAINRFPDDNPNPVMRIDADGHLIYANPASAGVLNALGVVVGEQLPADVLARLEDAAPTRGYLEFVWENRTYAVWPVQIPDLNFTNLYGTDVTAERAIVKFPDQNPNPVFRITWDGTLVYANPASAGLVAGLGLRSERTSHRNFGIRCSRGYALPTGRRSRSRRAVERTLSCPSTSLNSLSSTSTART